MDPGRDFLRLLELDRTTFPEMRDRIQAYSSDPAFIQPRSYPGYPRWPLETIRPRIFTSLEKVLRERRSSGRLDSALPDRSTLSRLLYFSHGAGAVGDDGVWRGPVPSAGSLQAVELFLVVLHGGWLPAGTYHYDRAGHHLSQTVAGAERDAWTALVPSLRMAEGGSLLWMIVGDGPRAEGKYGLRAYRFLLQESGHLMQNICLLSASLGLCTLPLGGCLEREAAHAMALPASDVVLYTGLLGRAIN